MQKQLKSLIEFHEGFDLPWNAKPTTQVYGRVRDLRRQLMEEELLEVSDSMRANSLPDLAKELVDLLYTVYGTIVTYGLQDHIEEVFDRVHQSNMSKLVDGKPLYREDGKVLKGPNYKEPDLSFLNNIANE